MRLYCCCTGSEPCNRHNPNPYWRPFTPAEVRAAVEKVETDPAWKKILGKMSELSANWARSLREGTKTRKEFEEMLMAENPGNAAQVDALKVMIAAYIADNAKLGREADSLAATIERLEDAKRLAEADRDHARKDATDMAFNFHGVRAELETYKKVWGGKINEADKVIAHLRAELVQRTTERNNARASVCNHDTTEIERVREDSQNMQVRLASATRGMQSYQDDNTRKVDVINNLRKEEASLREQLRVARDVACVPNHCIHYADLVQRTKERDQYKATVQQSINEAFAVVLKTAYEDFTQRQGCAPMPKWQPIATAPKDESAILVTWPKGVPAVAQWAKACDKWAVVGSDIFLSPTHWMPLPGSPK